MGGRIGFPSGWEPVNPSGTSSSRPAARRGKSAPPPQFTTREKKG